MTLQRNRQGHYITNGQINGHRVVFMLDTGATGVAVSEYLVEKLNLERGSSIELRTANGRATGYMTNIELIGVGDIELKHPKAIINPNDKEGMIFLGMSFLKKIEFTQRGDELTLHCARDQICEPSLNDKEGTDWGYITKARPCKIKSYPSRQHLSGLNRRAWL